VRSLKRSSVASAAISVAVGAALLWVAAAQPAPGDPKKRIKVADQAYARSVLLRKADLPAGRWRIESTDFSQPNPACLVKHYSLGALTATAQAGFTYTLGGGIPVIESDANMFLTAAQAQRAVSISTKLGLARCLGAAFAAEVQKNTSGVSANVVKVEAFSFAGLGATARGFRIVLQLRSSQSVTSLDTVLVIVRRARAVAWLSLVQAGSAWPSSTVRSLAATTAGRMTKH